MSIEVTGLQRDQTPYRNIGLLVTHWSTGERSAATAVLVGRNDVLTAAHAVYNPSRGGWATSVEVYFGADYDFTSSQFQDTGDTVRTTRWSAVTFRQQAYSDNDDTTFTQAESQYDVALFGVDTAIGDRIGWLQLAAGYDSTQSVEAIGYPSDGTGMMTERATVTASSIYSLYESSVGVFGPGSSGGPILVGNEVIGIKSTSAWWADVGGANVYSTLLEAMVANDTVLDSRARPSVASITPLDGTTAASISANVIVRYSEMIKRGAGELRRSGL
jgi:V8-like Glu-specific endopeptidase